MAATKYITVHLIPVVRKDEKSGLVKRKNIQPGTVVTDFTADEVKRLKALGAIKEYAGETKAEETSSKEVDGQSTEGGNAETTREELLAKAEKLGLNVPKNIGDAKLKERVEEAEKAAADDDGL